MHDSTPFTRLSPWERRGLACLLAVVVLFGVLVEVRAAFLQRRMGDLGVFLRAAWAVRAGADPYAVVDNNNWHYCYPPLLAIVLAPFADPPPGVELSAAVPYAVTAGLWYLLNVLCLALGVHALAAALERTSPDPAVRGLPRGCRRWWALRVLPVLVCLPPVGHTLMRGQVNVLLLALLCGLAAGLLRGRRLTAGLCLAGAICVKVIPAFLVIYPLWRRDGRCLAGCALGLFLGLVAIPVAALGPTQALRHYETWAEVLIRPALGAGGDQSRAKELIEVKATATQAFQAAIHNTLHLDRDTRPAHPAPWVRAVHWGLGGFLTLLTLAAVGWRRRLDGPSAALAVGALTVLMMLLSPVCHLHYFVLSVPLVMGLLADAWERGAALRLGGGLAALLAVYLAANILPQLPGLHILRDLCLAMYGAMLLWLAAVTRLWVRGRAGHEVAAQTSVRGLAA